MTGFQHIVDNMLQHVVANFVERLLPLLELMRQTWDDHCYHACVDAHGQRFQEPAAEAMAESALQFSPSMLTTTLRSSYFALCAGVPSVAGGS